MLRHVVMKGLGGLDKELWTHTRKEVLGWVA